MTPEKRVYNSILDTIGNTPLIKLNKVTADFPCPVYAKVDYFNPGNSIKDRMAVKMLDVAEAEGKIKPGDVITADNVEHVEHLLDPVATMQVKTMGRRIHIVGPVKKVSQMMPGEFPEATTGKAGQAGVGEAGKV